MSKHINDFTHGFLNECIRQGLDADTSATMLATAVQEGLVKRAANPLSWIAGKLGKVKPNGAVRSLPNRIGNATAIGAGATALGGGAMYGINQLRNKPPATPQVPSEWLNAATSAPSQFASQSTSGNTAGAQTPAGQHLMRQFYGDAPNTGGASTAPAPQNNSVLGSTQFSRQSEGIRTQATTEQGRLAAMQSQRDELAGRAKTDYTALQQLKQLDQQITGVRSNISSLNGSINTLQSDMVGKENSYDAQRAQAAKALEEYNRTGSARAREMAQALSGEYESSQNGTGWLSRTSQKLFNRLNGIDEQAGRRWNDYNGTMQNVERSYQQQPSNFYY